MDAECAVKKGSNRRIGFAENTACFRIQIVGLIRTDSRQDRLALAGSPRQGRYADE